MRGQCFGAVADPLGDLSWDYFRTVSPVPTPSALGASR